ncbi:MAG: GTP-binding protein [Candidatus Hodarchaeales archaeon]|jgi:Ras-related protein Rab-8A
MAILVKICLLGDGAVGKTSLKNRFLGGGFDPKYLITIGADFAVRDVEIPSGEKYKLQIWDLAGQPRFDAVRTLYYRGSMGALLIFDITNRASLENLENWVKEYWRNSGETSVPMIVIANKKDLRGQLPSSITEEEGKQFIEALSAKSSTIGIKFRYLETSAKSGENVEESFIRLASEIHNFLKSSGTLPQ